MAVSKDLFCIETSNKGFVLHNFMGHSATAAGVTIAPARSCKNQGKTHAITDDHECGANVC